MATVLLATDGSDYARGATETAVQLARDRDANLHVLSVVDRRKVPEPALSSDELTTILAEESGFDHINEVKRLAEQFEVSVSGDVYHGVPDETILREADRRDAETIVLGEHGERRGHLGGVGRTVRRYAPCEVVVVPGRTTA